MTIAVSSGKISIMSHWEATSETPLAPKSNFPDHQLINLRKKIGRRYQHSMWEMGSDAFATRSKHIVHYFAQISLHTEKLPHISKALHEKLSDFEAV